MKSCAARWDKIARLVEERKSEALDLIEGLGINNDMMQNNDLVESSFSKLYVLTDKESVHIIKKLNESGIEAMHLEHKHKVYYQLPPWENVFFNTIKSPLPVAKFIYNAIISLPVEINSNEPVNLKIKQVMED